MKYTPGNKGLRPMKYNPGPDRTSWENPPNYLTGELDKDKGKRRAKSKAAKKARRKGRKKN